MQGGEKSGAEDYEEALQDTALSSDASNGVENLPAVNHYHIVFNA